MGKLTKRQFISFISLVKEMRDKEKERDIAFDKDDFGKGMLLDGTIYDLKLMIDEMIEKLIESNGTL